MIVTDGLHLISDGGTAELHAFAGGLGLPRRWFHRDHYDLLTAEAASGAVAGGAVLVGLMELGRVRKAAREGTAYSCSPIEPTDEARRIEAAGAAHARLMLRFRRKRRSPGG